MWIPRDFDGRRIAAGALPIKVLKGPRQVGKTSVLERMTTHRVVYLDVVERWVVTPDGDGSRGSEQVVPFTRIWEELDRVEPMR